MTIHHLAYRHSYLHAHPLSITAACVPQLDEDDDLTMVCYLLAMTNLCRLAMTIHPLKWRFLL